MRHLAPTPPKTLRNLEPIRRCLITVLASILLALLLRQVSASAAVLSITPLRQEIELRPGQTVVRNLYVFNATQDTETVSVKATSFNTVDKHYNYAFGAPPDLSSWIQFIEDQATVLPGQQHTFIYNIAVPNDAEPGGKYIAVFASTTDIGQSSPVVERVGSLVYLSVTGKETRSGGLISSTVPIINFTSNSPWDIQIQNKGNTHFTSRITTQVSHWYGQTVASSSQDHLILPGTIRELSGINRFGEWPDLYRLKLSIGLGDTGTVQKSFWLVYLPPLPSLATLVVMAAVVGLMVRKLRRKRLPV